DQQESKNHPDFSQLPEQPTGSRRGRRTRSQEEMDRRISFAACLLSQLVPTAEIKAQLERRYECSRRMCEKYISRGRERLKKWSEIPPEQVRNEIVGLLQGLLRSNLGVREKLAAIDRLIEIYGLAAPTEQTIKGDRKQPVTLEV